MLDLLYDIIQELGAANISIIETGDDLHINLFEGVLMVYSSKLPTGTFNVHIKNNTNYVLKHIQSVLRTAHLPEEAQHDPINAILYINSLFSSYN